MDKLVGLVKAASRCPMTAVAMHPCVVYSLLGIVSLVTLRILYVAIVPVTWRGKKITGQVCLITGSAAGIGRQMAKLFSAQRCKMVLVDINKDALSQAADDCRSCGAESVNVYTCDLSDRKQVYEMTDKVKADLGHVDILVNNAGIVSGKAMLELDDERNIDRSFKINAICHFWLIKSFLPGMLENDRGHIVTIASMAGIHCSTTRMMDYAASKYAAVGLAETLEFELRFQYATKNIHSTLVCPYFIATGMFHGVSLRFQWLLPYMSPEYVASRVFGGVLLNKSIVVLPPWLYLLACVKYMMPSNFRLWLSQFLGTTGSMNTFEGRKTK